MKSIKTGEERKLRRKFQNYLFPFQIGKRKANLIFFLQNRNAVFRAAGGLWDGHARRGRRFPRWVMQSWGCCGLSAPHRKVCRDGTTLSLSLWALMSLTQRSSIAVKTGGVAPS